MRWIKGDTPPHIDFGASAFENTYLVYLTDSPGKLVISSQSYSIRNNTGVIINERVLHETQNTENVPRLLLGPMNELAESVGTVGTIMYYDSETDALNLLNRIGFEFSVTISEVGSWRIASNSTGSSPQNVTYVTGNILNADGNYYLYRSAPCFLQGTTVLCKINDDDQYIPIEQLTPGILVKTCESGYKPIVLIGKDILRNPGNNERTENRLYKCSTAKYMQLKEDLYITGCHSILEFFITEKQKEDIIKHLGKIFVTDNRYRLIACVDDRAEPWNSEGDYTIWHFALEGINIYTNYGVYVNGGLLVETCSINFLKNKSNMKIVE